MASFQTDSQRALQSALNRLAAAKAAAVKSGSPFNAGSKDPTMVVRPPVASQQTFAQPLAIRPVTTVPIDNKTGMPFKPQKAEGVPPARPSIFDNPNAMAPLPPKEVAVPYAPFTTVGYGGGNHPGGTDYRLVPQNPTGPLTAIDAALAPRVVGQEQNTAALPQGGQFPGGLTARLREQLMPRMAIGRPIEANAYSGEEQVADTPGAMIPGPDPRVTAGMQRYRALNSPTAIAMNGLPSNFINPNFVPNFGLANYAGQSGQSISGGGDASSGGPQDTYYSVAAWRAAGSPSNARVLG